MTPDAVELVQPVVFVVARLIAARPIVEGDVLRETGHDELDAVVVVAGDVSVSLANVELLTIQIRLLICSIDKAEQIGMDWWRTDPRLSTHAKAAAIPPSTHAASAERQQESRHGS